MAPRHLDIKEVFWAYSEPGLVLSYETVWVRFDQEFVRVMNEQGLKEKDLANVIGISWEKLNSRAKRDTHPKWLTVPVLATLSVNGFDLDYIMTGRRRKQPLRPGEAALLDNYRNSTPDNQAVLRKIGAALEKQLDDDGEMCA